MLCSLRSPAAGTRRPEELTTRATRLVRRTVPGDGEPTVHCAGSWPRRLGRHDGDAATGRLAMSVLTGRSQSSVSINQSINQPINTSSAAGALLSCQYVGLEFAVDECSPSSRLGGKAMGAWASRWQRFEGWSEREGGTRYALARGSQPVHQAERGMRTRSARVGKMCRSVVTADVVVRLSGRPDLT